MRGQFDHIVRLFLNRSPILPCTMLMMDLRVIQHWIRWLSARRRLAQRFQILLEQRVDDRDHLPCNPTDHLTPAGVLVCFLVETALDGDQPLVDLAPLTVFEPNGLPHDQIHGQLHLALAAWSQSHMVERRARLSNAGCPPKIGFELSSPLKVGDGANTGKDRSRLGRANAWNRGQDLTLSAMVDYLRHFGFQLLQVGLNELQFGDELCLLEDEAAQPSWFFGSDTLHGEPLQFQEFGIGERTILPAQLLEVQQTGCSQRGRRREALANGQGGGKVGIFQDLDKLRKNLVADRGQLVFASGAFDGQFLSMLHHATQLRGSFRWRSQTTNGLHGIAHLNTLLQLIEQEVSQAQRIPLVRFEQALLALLDVHHVDRKIQLLQIVEQRPMVVASHFHDHIHLGQRHIATDAVDQAPKPFTRVLKGQGWTVFKALVPTEQCRRDEACNVGFLANIHAHIQGFAGKPGDDLKIGLRCSLCHDHSSFPLTTQQNWLAFFITWPVYHLPGQSQGQGLRRHSAPLRGPLTLAAASWSMSGVMKKSKKYGMEKRSTVGMLQPTLDKESGLQTLIRCTNVPPSLSLRVKAPSAGKVLRYLLWEGATLPCFSTCHCSAFFASFQMESVDD